MVLITLQYIPLRYDVAFLNIKQQQIGNIHYKIAFFSHVYTSIFVLIAGIPQFSGYVRRKYATVHKNLGKAYILLILLVAAPSGLIMGIEANGGTSSKISFVLQAILWFVFTFIAYQKAKSKDWQQHKNFMLRSYALTLGAITLRWLKFALASTLALPPMDIYRIIAWAGWLLNLIVIELYILKTNKCSLV
ncbi:hypothetical protein Y10_02810 [Neptunitalea sp. Y10]|uniref:DUF2306 domain-containing protein n=2 Tax=Neptunitalea lumnitzerae TaxID=2965509 RepID=A0ABQ5MEW3_9FLAO|nr:hypothetical protein Y10_02810 [Neptunitalea sp. Y10]